MGKKKDNKRSSQLDLSFDDASDDKKKKLSSYYEPTKEDWQFLTEMNDPDGQYITEEERKKREEESKKSFREVIEKFKRNQ